MTLESKYMKASSEHMNKPLSYSVVIVEYFSDEHLFACIDSLNQQSHRAEKIVVVLNGYKSEARQKIESNYKEVLLIDPKANLGYSKAANLGIANTSSEIVLTLNPDAYLEKDSALNACQYFADDPKVGTIGPRIYETGGEIYPSARNEPELKVAIGHALLGSIFPKNKFTKQYKNLEVDPEISREVDWLSGAAIYIRRQALNEIGGWDEDYFMYCEDIDLGRKMRINRWKNVYLPSSEATHAQGISTGKTPISLLIEHHKSLYIFASKKYEKNPLIKVMVAVFIGFRLPLALAIHLLRIN